MSSRRRRRPLVEEAFCSTKRRREEDEAVEVRSSLQQLMMLFSCQLFSDILPPVALKHQLYSLHSDRTCVDKQLNALCESGELLMFQLGFSTEAFALVFADQYKAKVLQGEAGRETESSVQKFLRALSTSCTSLSFDKHQLITDLLFSDAEITQLVKAGVLTVKDAGSWWLAIPNSGKFIKYLLEGRRAVLNMVKKSKYGEILKNELEERRTTSKIKFKMKYHIHDLIGAELVECVQTTSGTLLRYVDGSLALVTHSSSKQKELEVAQVLCVVSS
ncbi:hypothetical protein DNTS_026622 [Danionella cerebrum]|uniref:Serine/threonine-protein kinase 19 n=1 Tax=Danionella cerebrum TaxID=2873325 RepID=A0A553QDN6_9TELE|nr:hypothetical protein DNTS_026622 [Danionella translucida]